MEIGMIVLVIIVGSLITCALLAYVFYKARRLHNEFHGWWCMYCVKKFGIKKSLSFFVKLGTLWMNYGNKKNDKK